MSRKKCYRVWRSRDPKRIHAQAKKLFAWWKKALARTSKRRIAWIARRKKKRKFRTFRWWWDRHRRNKQYRLIDAVDRLIQPVLNKYPQELYTDLIKTAASFIGHKAMYPPVETNLISRITRWMQRRPHPKMAAKLSKSFAKHILTEKECPWRYVVFMATYNLKTLQSISPKISPKWCKERRLFLRVRYMSLANIKKKLLKWSKKYPKVFKLHTIGHSIEGRPLWALQVGRRTRRAKRLAVMMVGSQHGDEHMGAEVIMKLGESLFNRYSKKNKEVRSWFRTRNIWLVPVINPDGIHFDMVGGLVKYWRYNRSRQQDGQIGVDLNRNWGFKWTYWRYYGRFNLPGRRAFSEPETNALRKLIVKIPNLKGLLDVHQYGRVLLHPYAYTKKLMPAPYQELHINFGKYLTKMNRYRVKPARHLYPHQGTLGDWAFGSRKLISYVLELGYRLYLSPRLHKQVVRNNELLFKRFITMDQAPFPLLEHFQNKKSFIQAN